MTQGILAIDIGLRYGWSLLSEDNRVTFGEESIGSFKGLQSGARFPAFRSRLEPIFQEWAGRGTLAYELVRGSFLTDETALSLYGMRAVLMELVAVHGWPATKPIGTTSLKKQVTGKGTAKKPAMIEAACRRWGLVAAGDNEADALLILSWAMKLTKRQEAGPARRCGGGPAIAPIKLAGHDRTGEWGYAKEEG